MIARAAFGLLLAAASAPLAARQAAPPADNPLSFGPDFFAEARPADAYEMVRRLPGFTLVENDPEIRGYAGAAGNVLIDGKPPSGKQETLETILRRLPASSVARIELIRAGAGVEAGGHAVVANVVRSLAVTRRATIEGGAAMARDGVVRPELQLEGSYQGPSSRIEAAAGIDNDVDEDTGRGRISVADGSGTITERVARREWEDVQTLSASAAHERRLGGGELNASASISRERTREAILTGSDLARERERLLAAEASARWQRGLGTGKRLEALLLHRIERLRARSSEGDDRFDEATDSSETIGRLTLRRSRGALDLDAAVEGALNRLDSAALLTEGGTPVPLPGSDAHVEEDRLEGSVGATWRPSSSLVVEPRLALESSRIASTGDTANVRAFLYAKPRLAASLALGGSDQLRFGWAREVGQLDFEDFVASASLDRDDVSAGAVRLRPARSWVLSAAYEHRFWGEGALVVDYRQEWIEDVIDRVAVVADGETFDAVGNIGSGRRHVAKVELTAPLSRLGLKGILLRSAITFRHSRVTDPVTGRRRIISEDKPVEGEIRLSQDLMEGRLSWGLDATLGEREWQFRFDEVRLETEALRLTFHVEYRPAADWRLRLEAANFTSRTLADRREKYEGPRDAAALKEIERRRIATTPIFSFSLRKSFGRS